MTDTLAERPGTADEGPADGQPGRRLPRQPAVEPRLRAR